MNNLEILFEAKELLLTIVYFITFGITSLIYITGKMDYDSVLRQVCLYANIAGLVMSIWGITRIYCSYNIFRPYIIFYYILLMIFFYINASFFMLPRCAFKKSDWRYNYILYITIILLASSSLIVFAQLFFGGVIWKSPPDYELTALKKSEEVLNMFRLEKQKLEESLKQQKEETRKTEKSIKDMDDEIKSIINKPSSTSGRSFSTPGSTPSVSPGSTPSASPYKQGVRPTAEQIAGLIAGSSRAPSVAGSSRASVAGLRSGLGPGLGPGLGLGPGSISSRILP
jgi:hypothetical protein